MPVKNISYRNSGLFETLILDYLDSKPDVIELAGLPMEVESILEKAKQRAAHPMNRQALVSSLKEAYSGHETDYPLTLEQIEKLNQSTSFTITTGHQLCLFTGPLYFIYKIFSLSN